MSTRRSPHTRSGVLASAAASCLFATIFLLPPQLRPLSPNQVFGYRIVAMVGFLSLYFTARRMWPQVHELCRRLWAAPLLVAALVVDAALIGAQMWLFGWAPATGHGLQTSLGYLILPLVMVVVSVLMLGERLSRLRLAAVVCAAVGVAAALVGAGGLGWPTLLVALGLPPYFAIRRRLRLDSAAAQLLELVALLPFSAWIAVRDPAIGLVAARPALLGVLLLFGLLSAAAFALYLTASRILPLGLFGVLGYVEPVLLVLVSLLVLGEPWRPEDALTYGPICLGLVLLALEARAPRVPEPTPRQQVGSEQLNRARAVAAGSAGSSAMTGS